MFCQKKNGYVCLQGGNSKCSAYFNPKFIKNVKYVGVEVEKEGGIEIKLYKYKFDYKDDEHAHGILQKCIAFCREKSGFHNDINQALQERSDPNWIDPLFK